MKPNLKIIETKNIIPVMDFKERRTEHLRQLIEKSGSIRNLFNLAGVGPHEYLLLEDTAVLEAVRRLKIEYVPAQVIPLKRHKKIKADISVSGMKQSYIDEFDKMFPRSFTVGKNNCSLKDFGCILVSISQKNQSDIEMYFKRNGAGLISGTLFDFFGFLDSRCILEERINPTSVKTTNVKRNNESCLLTVSNLTPDDLLFAARQNYFYPAGLLRFDYGIRIIGIDFPLKVLKENVSVREKERFLYDLMNYRLNSGYSNFIKNGVYLLNY